MYVFTRLLLARPHLALTLAEVFWELGKWKKRKNKDHSKSSSQSVKKCSTSLGEEYLKKKKHSKRSAQAEWKGMVEQPILLSKRWRKKPYSKILGRTKHTFLRQGELKGRVGSTELTFKGWGGVKYPVGYKNQNNIGVKGQDIAFPFFPPLDIHSAYWKR